MKFHELPVSMFEGEGPFLACADSLIQKQRNEIPGIPEAHPDIIMEGHAVANQYWYICIDGSIKQL